MKTLLLVSFVVVIIVGIACAIGNFQLLYGSISFLIDIYPYPIFLIPLAICTSAFCVMIKWHNKAVKALMGLFILASLTFLFGIIYPLFNTRHPTSCDRQFEEEASDVAAILQDYFSVPSRTQVPSIDDLVNLMGYVLPKNRKVIHKDEYVKESELVVTISGDVNNGIIIEVTSKKGKCFKGEAYIYRIFDDRAEGEWIDSNIEN